MNIYWIVGLSLLLLASLRGDAVRTAIGKEITIPLRGIAIIVIVLYHLAQRVGTQVPLLGFFFVGPTVVGVFFVLSGYGLAKQVQNKDYLPGFLSRSAKKLFIPFLVCMVFWWLYLMCCKQLDVPAAFIAFMQRGRTPLPNSWYLFELYLFYVIFWISHKCAVGKMTAWLVGGLSFIMFLGLIISPWGCEYWLSALAFPAGVLVAAYENLIVEKRKILCGCVSGVLLAIYGLTRGLNVHSALFNLLYVSYNALVGCVCMLIMEASCISVGAQVGK